ncbi:uncharacterized protein [Dysidea avara]|uniref:uncharacterized protein n=1 Tax=Dysidea avara TaxID=196820 RepID=UPI003325B9AE
MLLVTCCLVVIFLTKELVVATDQCSSYGGGQQFKTPLSTGESCEAIYNKNHNKSGYYWILSNRYCGMNYNGSSCKDIYNNYPETANKSGYYRIDESQWVYCDMTAIADDATNIIPTCAGIGGGWKRIALINISAGDDCPGEWIKASKRSGVFCRVTSNDTNICSSAKFSTNGISYQRVCGMARGYQKGNSEGFASSEKSIDGAYVSGLSLTHGNPRQHIWTFANGLSEHCSTKAVNNCPCAADDAGSLPPPFVGSNYYCESGALRCPIYVGHFLHDALWDGKKCMSSKCCDNKTQPWFHHQLDQPTNNDIEARICSSGPFDERSTLIDQLELYIQ